MKKIFSLLILISALINLYAQPEINCNLIHTDPAESEYILPFRTGKTYKLTQSNCHPTGGHRLTFAYDFDTKIGDTIIACRAGVVTFVNDQYADTDWTSGHENNVFIGHSDGTRIRYTHLKKGGVLVRVGQQIEQGQPIGISGNSGNTGGFPHLHLAAFNDATSFSRQNTIPLNFCNTDDPLNSQNLLIEGNNYTARSKTVTSVENPTSLGNFVISPNPTSTMLSIIFDQPDFNIDLVQILDVGGNIFYNKKLDSGLSNLNIAVNEYAVGVYYLILKKGQKRVVRKFMVIR